MGVRVMRHITIISAIAIALLPSPVFAGRSWFQLNYQTAECIAAPLSPAQFRLGSLGMSGVSVDPIAPGDVTKYPNGEIRVEVTGTVNGRPTQWLFFTSIGECSAYVFTEGIHPEGAPTDDIN
jgi:hypothetical protein